MRSILLCGLALALTSCASITRGTTETVVINYSPTNAKVTTTLGQTCTANPCSLIVPRKEKFVVEASAPGYDSQSIAVNTKVSGQGGSALAGNILFGGVIGVGVDAASGATLDHFPNPVNIELRKVGSPAPEPAPVTAAPPKRRGTPTS